MSSFRTKLIKLAFENPDLRKELLPLLKEGGAALKLVEDGYDEDGFKNLTPEQRFKIYKKKTPNTKLDSSHEMFQDKGDKSKPQKGKVDLDEEEDGDQNVIQFPTPKPQSGGDGGDDSGPADKTEPKEEKGKEEKGKGKAKPAPKKVNPPKFERLKGRNISKKQQREKSEADLQQGIVDKYKDKVDENGDFPPEIVNKMNEEYSRGMNDLEQADLDAQKKKNQEEKDSFLKGKDNANKKRREDHSNAVLEKLKAKHGDNKELIGEKHQKAMNKYDDKVKKKQKMKDDGIIKTFQQSKNKWKGLVKKLDPENLKSLITASQRVAARHESKTEIEMKPSKSRVASRHQKTAGGSDFTDFMHGSDPRRCFIEAQKDAQYEYGSGGYTGTIAEKHSYQIVSRTPMTEEQARSFMNDYGYKDKWGPAFAIPVAEETELARKEYTVKVKARNGDEAKKLAKELIRAKGRTRRGATISVEIPYTRSSIVKTKEAGKPKMGFEADAEKGIFISTRPITNVDSWDSVAYGSKRDAAAAAKNEIINRPNEFGVGKGFHIYEINKLGTVKVTGEPTRLAEYQVTGTRIQSAVSSKIKGWYFWGIASS